MGIFEPGDAVDVFFDGTWIPAYFCRYEGTDECLVKYAGNRSSAATLKACWPGSYYQPNLATVRHAITVELFQITDPVCDCGAIKARTTHSHWCSTNSP